LSSDTRPLSSAWAHQFLLLQLDFALQLIKYLGPLFFGLSASASKTPKPRWDAIIYPNKKNDELYLQGRH